MSWWSDFRDDLESVAGVVANYFYPGTGILGQWVNSKGSQQQLYGTDLGRIAMGVGGLAGGYAGNMSNYGTAMDGLSGGAGAGAGNAGDVGSGMGTIAGGGTKTYEDLVQQYMQAGAAPEDAMAWAQQAAGPTGVTVGNAGQLGVGPGFTGTGTMGGGAPAANANNAWASGAAASTVGTSAAKAVGSMPWGSPGNLASLGSGVLGLMASNQMSQAGQLAQRQADPFGPQRQQYADQLSALNADPSSVTKLPGYEAGMQAVKRSMASQGFTGSGNMMAAMQKYGGDFFNNAMQMYSGLAGAQFNPAAGAQLGLQGTQAGLGIAGQALGSLGYGSYMAGNQWPWQQRSGSQ